VNLGLHCSIRGGHLGALQEADRLGLTSMQIFAYRRHEEPLEGELQAFRQAREKSRVKRLLVHARYVPFLASRDPKRHEHSARLLARELKLSHSLGAEGLVVHAGAYSPEDDGPRGLARAAEGVLRAWGAAAARVPIILENVPGGGRRMGGSLEELADLGGLLLGRGVDVRYCLDTAHAWAYGYDIASAEGMWKFLGRANRLLGKDMVTAFHLNDTRAIFGSHREHHWHWGQGHLGTDGLKTLLGRPEFTDAAGILETPRGERDRPNLELVRSLTG